MILNDVNKGILEEINFIIPKLKYSLNPYIIFDWLSNFEEKDYLRALDILFFVEYYSENDIIQVFDEHISTATKIVLDKFEKKKVQLVFIPVLPKDNDGKSGALMKYYLNKTPTYRKLLKRFGAKNIILKTRIENINLRKNTAVFLIDDFIGSGGTICDFLDDNKRFFLRRVIDLRVVCLAHMEGAKKHILDRGYNWLPIHGDLKTKVLNSKDSVLLMQYENLSEIEKFINETKEKFINNSNGKKFAFGYNDSQALISFAHGCPNNTLSLIWSSDKKVGGETWNPIYPRTSSSRIDHAKLIKQSTAYWIGIMNRLKINITESFELENYKGARQSSAERKNKVREIFIITTVLTLKNLKFGDGSIAQILGITSKELKSYINIGTSKGLIDKKGVISSKGITFLRKMNNTLTQMPIHKLKKNNYKIMSAEEYVFTK